MSPAYASHVAAAHECKAFGIPPSESEEVYIGGADDSSDDEITKSRATHMNIAVQLFGNILPRPQSVVATTGSSTAPLPAPAPPAPRPTHSHRTCRTSPTSSCLSCTAVSAPALGSGDCTWDLPEQIEVRRCMGGKVSMSKSTMNSVVDELNMFASKVARVSLEECISRGQMFKPDVQGMYYVLDNYDLNNSSYELLPSESKLC